MKIILDVRFEKFLKDNRVYAPFIRNLKNHYNESEIKVWLKNNHRGYSILSIASAFIWIKTKQGQDFWLDIENKWRKEFNNSAPITHPSF